MPTPWRTRAQMHVRTQGQGTYVEHEMCKVVGQIAEGDRDALIQLVAEALIPLYPDDVVSKLTRYFVSRVVHRFRGSRLDLTENSDSQYVLV